MNELSTLVFKLYKPQDRKVQTAHVLLAAKHLLWKSLTSSLEESFVTISEQRTALLDNEVYFSKL